MKLPEVLLIDDKFGGPEGINMVIGHRPQAAFGSSTTTAKRSNTRGWSRETGNEMNLIFFNNNTTLITLSEIQYQPAGTNASDERRCENPPSIRPLLHNRAAERQSFYDLYSPRCGYHGGSGL